ncbi:MAG: hypothetical protein EPN14_06190 [Gallionella sp.]|nr:MAG: hypothetical protein EPN14_06190 [Gallionella sp.]
MVLNLIVGSLVMNNHPELYPSFFHLDLNYFFKPVRGEHLWLYALLVTFSLFGINLLACTVDSVIRLIGTRAGRLKASAALLFHIALLSTMAAHLFEGFYASTSRTMIAAQGVALPGLGNVRVESLKNIYYPDNSLKDTEVALLFNSPDGRQLKKEIAFNEPAIFDGGRRQVVMLSGQTMPGGVAIARDTDNREFRLEVNKPQPLESGVLLLQGLFQTDTGMPFAQFLWQSDNGDRQRLFMALDARQAHHAQIGITGATYRFKEIVETPFIVAIVRHNPAIPLILASLILASTATFLLIGWLRTRNRIL